MTDAPPSILVVDDNPDNVAVLLECLKREGFRVLVAQDGESALHRAEYAHPELILLDVMLPGMSGFETCQRLKEGERTRDIPVIFLTALGETSEKIEGFGVGAVDYLTKPFHYEEVIARVRLHLLLQRYRDDLEAANTQLEERVRARTAELEITLDENRRLRDRLLAENTYLKEELGAEHRDIIGSSPALAAVLAKIALVAPTDSTVLLAGETGTGKELMARAIHQSSRRRDGPLVMLNCAAISAGLVESELFGHVKGAFTGASDKRIGRFELADGGTLFLDEVSELPLDTQVKLLRVLQEQEFEPVGSSRSKRVDVRIVAATNRDLEREVAEGRFRADLYFRLKVFPIELPPLRVRITDLPELAQSFVARLSRKVGRPIRGFAPGTLETLQAYEWPGNIRELHNTIERAIVSSVDGWLRIDWALRGRATQAPTAAKAEARDSTPRGVRLQEVEREHILGVLRQTRGVIEGPDGAARLLDLKPSTARHRIRKLGIRKSDYL